MKISPLKECYVLVQAVLPLRGKILNIERKDEAAMYKNEEIQNLILALGLGVKVILLYILVSFFLTAWLIFVHSIFTGFRERILKRTLFDIIKS